MTKGQIFLHKRWLDAQFMPQRIPLRCIVTRIAQGVIYYRPLYGAHDDGTPWLGAPSYFPISDAHKYILPSTSPAQNVPPTSPAPPA